jgi:hypothetical protein
MRKLLKIAGGVALAVLGFLLLGGGLFAVTVLSRQPLRAVPSTRHASLGRAACIECHAPIADEWRQSYHFKSLTGPYWQDVRQLGYLGIFDKVRKQCVNCHAPARSRKGWRARWRPWASSGGAALWHGLCSSTRARDARRARSGRCHTCEP